MDNLVSIGQLHSLKMKDVHDFVAQAYVDDTNFLSQNNPNDMRVIMDALKLYELAFGLHVNFNKFKLLPLPPHVSTHYLYCVQFKATEVGTHKALLPLLMLGSQEEDKIVSKGV